MHVVMLEQDQHDFEPQMLGEVVEDHARCLDLRRR
jgi:hypothetical protein